MPERMWSKGNILIAGGNANLYNHSGNQYCGFSKNREATYHLKTWAYTQRMLNHTKRTLVQLFSKQHY